MIEFLNVDCMDYMAALPDKAFDLGSGDPPYFKRVGKMGYFGKNQSSLNVKRGQYNIPNWDNQLPTENYFNELKRVSKDWAIWGANYYDFIGHVHKTPRRNDLNKWIDEHPTGWIVWDKVNGNSDFNDYELCCTSFDMPTTVFTFLWNGMLQASSLSRPDIAEGNKKLNQKRIHPTQKPIQLYQWLFSLLNFRSVLETHGGSFSAGIASDRLNIDMTICELDKDYFDAGVKRFKEQTQQIQMFKP